MKIELLHTDDCPNFAIALGQVRDMLEATGAQADVELRRVVSHEQALKERFLGSPTVRINGLDVEPGAGSRRDYGIKCRLYRTNAGIAQVPAKSWVLEALGPRTSA